MDQWDTATWQSEESWAAIWAREVSLIRGGPFYRGQESFNLLSSQRWNLGRRVAIVIGVAWIPLVIITLVFQPSAIGSLLSDYTVNTRMLIALPVLLAGQVIMENAFRLIIYQIRDAALLAPSEEAKMDITLSWLVRLRNSAFAEIVIAAGAYVHVVNILVTRINIAQPWVLAAPGSGSVLSVAGYYYALVGHPLYQFLWGVSLWKWCIWICFLFRLARLKLQLVPTHPDQHGGIGFLGMTPLALSPTIFVTTAAIGATWRSEILHHNAHLMDFKVQAIVLVLISIFVAAAPLVFFVPRLIRLRRQGILQYGTLGQIHSVDFHKKWILRRAGHEGEFLDSADISALTDYASSYENVEKLKPFPVDHMAILGLILTVGIPILPVVLTEIPFMTVIKALMDAVK
ncbi:hypothetical protein [Terriglobus sp. TAA 43]|uniref:hypothetical protein n=1 Tax=Terriglobus sp. TAA 43 TaxID=278961 RepID=UPI000645FA7E|nr:hypothetical protein [Terriglobus sp. TAA 43]